MRLRLIAAFLGCLMISASLQAQTLSPRSITIYKAGIAHVVKRGELRFSNQTAILGGDIRPLLGTYWLNGEKGISMQFGVDTVKVQREVTDFYGLLSANKGHGFVMKYVHNRFPDTIRELRGEIIEYYPASRMLKLRNKGEAEFISITGYDIQSLSISGNEKTMLTTDSVYRVSKVFSESTDELQTAELHYVGQGFTWIPSYYVRVLDDKNVRMEMKALVENFAEPLIDVETDLVIGTPNLAFGMQLDPIINAGFDAQFDNAMRDMNFQNARASLSSNSLSIRSARESVADADMSAYFTQEYAAIGEKSFDLFKYKLGKITIPTQTKAYFPIFAEKVPFEEVYAAVLPDHVSFISSRMVRKDEQKSDVHHSFKLKNTTGYPFTTASVVVEDKNAQFLAQDRIIYTPQKSDALISISRAIDVDVKNTEEELSRDIDYKTIDKAVFGRAKIKGTIKLHNFQKKAIKVDVTKHLNGEATDAEQGGKIEVIPTQAVNQSSVIKWQVPLGPDEGKTIEYEYEVLWQTK